MTAVTICSDFGAQVNKVCHCFHCSPSICHEVMGLDAMIKFFECWVLSQVFHSPLSLSSRGSSVPLWFLHKGGIICISEVIDILISHDLEKTCAQIQDKGRCMGAQPLNCVRFVVTPVAYQTPLSMESFRQEYWNELPFPSLVDLPGPRIKPTSPALAWEFFTTEPLGKPRKGR